jgi:hypothetical protein
MRLYLIVVLISISWIINDTEYYSIYISVILMFSLEKYLLLSFVFQLSFFFLLLSFEFLIVLGINSLSEI